MSFNQSLRSTALTLTAIAAIVSATGCGNKADPFPPPLENPARTTDLSVEQRGQAAVLSFAFPTTTVSGGLLAPLERVEIYRTKKDMVAPLSGEVEEADGSAAEPADAADALSEETAATAPAITASEPETLEQPLEVLWAAEASEFMATAALVETFDAAAIEQATQGDRLSFRIELGEGGDERIAHTFAIKTYTSDKLVSAFSNLATLVQRTPPPPPTEFQLTAEAGGIRLTWAAVEDPESEPIAFRVYRRSAESRLYGPALIRLPGVATEYLDRSAKFEERYIYAVTSVGHENPTVESFFGGEREIDYADRFAPTPPTGLIALAEAGRVRLLWKASPEDDVVGYVIFRRPAGADFRRLTDREIVEVEYSDRTVEAGATYDYQVAAVDRSGNQSEPSSSVVARVP
jgi:hypothetical protein